MSGIHQILLGGSQAPAVDPYFYSVTSLLHGDGTNGGQNNTFLDSSTNNFTITRNGNTTQGSFSPFSQTGWGNYFNGPNTGSYLRTPASTDFQLGTSDFTIEFWAYTTDITSDTTVCQTDSGGSGFFGMLLNYSNGTNITWYATSNGSSWNVINGGVLCSAASIRNTWTHFAYVRNGSTFTAYVNGIAVYTTTSSASIYQSANQFVFGSSFAGSHPSNFGGYLSNFRYVKGTAVYTSNFTPSTTPLTAITNTKLLSCQANRFLDASASAHTLTVGGSPSVQPFSPFNPTTPYSTSAVGGSGYFDGSGDYLQAGTNANLALGSGDFTIEGWHYCTGYNGGGGLYSTINTYPSSTGLLFYIDSIGRYTIDVNGTILQPAGTAVLNAWVHWAVVRNGSTLSIYINGTSIGSVSSSTNYTDQYAVIGRTGAGTNSNLFLGYLSSTRMIKGTAVYTANFTPPTAPLTAVTNTSLLLNFTNAAIFDNAADADYETVGNAQISTSVKKYGTGSMSFDGTGDYLVTAAKPTMTLGTGDFTVEFWMYANTPQPSTRTPLLSFGNGFTTNVWDIQLNNTSPSITNQINVWAYNLNSAAVWLQGGPTIAASTWYHIAVCRNGSTFKLFVNGTQAATATSTSSIDGNSTTLQWQVAYNSPDYFNGYIDDIRITKGVARYNYNFTPPTAEFPNIGGTVTLTADPYFDYTTLLLPGNGTNGAQNNTFLDSSTNAFTITRNGNTTQGTFSPFSQTGWGNYFDGNGDYLTVADSATLEPGSSDFTIECWVYPTATGSYLGVFSKRANNSSAYSPVQVLIDNGTMVLGVSTSGSSWAIATSASASPPLNQWSHIAVVRNGTASNNVTLYLNGTSVVTGSVSSTALFDNSAAWAIGADAAAGTGPFAGYISNFRYVKGTAVYTGAFTPPTTPLTAITNTQLLTCQSNRFIDNSTNAFAITRNGDVSVQAFSPFNPTAAWSAATNGGSGYFDGSGDYLLSGGSSVLNLSTGDWTIQGWYYPTAYAAGNNVIAYVGQSAGDKIVIADISTGGSGLWYLLNGSAAITSSTKAPLNAWSFFALVKSGSTTTLYLNGVSLGTTTSVPTSSNKSLNLGSDAGAAPFQGYIADFRILNGTANTAVPTAPLTAITNTALLLNFTNAGIYDATSKNDLETVGNAQISTTQSKFGGSSMYFDGTGDYLVCNAATNNLYAFGTGDFTLEMWVYFNSVASGSLFEFRPASTNGAYPLIYFSSSGVLTYYANSNPQINSSSVSTGQWYHIALCRYGTATKMYLNGIQTGSTYTDSSNYLCRANGPLIGVTSSLSSDFLNGYVDDFRITKGIARYTSNFTPPTTAFLTL